MRPVRLGCVGCLTIIIVVALAGGALWAVEGLFREPDFVPVKADHQDWVAAQQAIFDIARRGRGRPGPGATFTLTEREVTAVVARQLSDATALPLSETSVRLLDGGVAEVAGRLPLSTAVRDLPLSSALDALPGRWSQRPVWMVARLRPRLEGKQGGRRYLALDIESFTVGRWPLPSVTSRLFLPTGAFRYLSIPVPSSVDAVSVERGRLVLRFES